MIVGVVAEVSGSLLAGLVVMSLCSGIGVIAGLMYPASRRELVVAGLRQGTVSDFLPANDDAFKSGDTLTNCAYCL